MMMRTTFLTCALALCGGVCVSAQEADFVSPLMGFFEAGVICAPDAVSTRVAPDTVAGTTNVVNDAPPFVSNGRLVPAVLGIGFGARAAVDSPVAADTVKMTVTHPPLVDSGVTEQSFVTSLGSRDDPGIIFYQFDYPYELVLGDWTMRASIGAVTLYETTFTVVPPNALPELAGVCGYLELLS